MANEISTLNIQEFNDNLQMLSQQMQSKFRNAVMVGQHTGEGARVVDQIGEVNLQKRTKQHADNVIIDVPHDARWVYIDDYNGGDYIDEEDRLRMSIQPDSKYVKAFVSAANRQMDDLIIEAFFADAKTGKYGATTTSFTAGNVLANTIGAAAATGMNTEKLLAAREIVLGGDIDLDDPDNELYCAISPNEERELLDQVKVVSTDYQDRAVLSGGGKRLERWFGINFILTNRLTDDGTDRLIPFWCKSGMHLGTWKDVFGDIRRDPSKQRNPIYIEAGFSGGATRTEEAKVVKIKCVL